MRAKLKLWVAFVLFLVVATVLLLGLPVPTKNPIEIKVMRDYWQSGFEHDIFAISAEKVEVKLRTDGIDRAYIEEQGLRDAVARHYDKIIIWVRWPSDVEAWQNWLKDPSGLPPAYPTFEPPN